MKLKNQAIAYFLGFWLFFVLLLVPMFGLEAQDSQPQVKVEIRVVEFGIIDLGKNSEPVFKFFLGKDETGKLLNKNGVCYHFQSKSRTNIIRLPDIRFPGQDTGLEAFFVSISQQSTFSFSMECYEDDKGEICTFDKKDEAHSVTTLILDLNNFVPGDFSDTIRITDAPNHFYSIIQLKYTLLPPAIIKSEPVLEAINNVTIPIRLSTSYPLINKNKLRFTWEYSTDGGALWQNAGTADPAELSLQLNPKKDLFKDLISNTEQVLFRCRVNSQDAEAISETLVTAFTPAPPVWKMEDITISPTCKGLAIGNILVKNLKPANSNIGYLLKKAIYSDDSCHLMNVNAGNCPGFVMAGEAVNGTIDLKKLPNDSFVLILYNTGFDVGNIYQKIPLQIPDFPAFKAVSITQKNPTCFDYRGGEIVALVEGGSREDSWLIELNPMEGTIERKPGQIAFKNLSEADYFLQISDGCGSVINRNIYLKKPEILEIESIRKEVSKGYIYTVKLKNGSGRYDVTISNTDQLQKKFDSSNLIIPFPLPGIWNIHIVDKTDPECVWKDTTINVASSQKILKENLAWQNGQNTESIFNFLLHTNMGTDWFDSGIRSIFKEEKGKLVASQMDAELLFKPLNATLIIPKLIVKTLI